MKKYVLGFCVLLMGLFAACGKNVGNDQRFLSDLSAGLTANYAVQADQPQAQTMEELQQQDPQERRQQMLECLRAEEKAFCESYTFEDRVGTFGPGVFVAASRTASAVGGTTGRSRVQPDARQAQILYQLVEGWNVTVDAPYEENLHNAWLTGGYFCEKDAICAALEPMFAQVKLIPKGNAYTLSAENCSGYDLSSVGFYFQFFDASGAVITEGNSGFQVDEYGLADVSGIPHTEDWNTGEMLEATFTPAAEFSRVEMQVSFCGPFARAHLPSPASTEFYEITWEK